MPKKPCYPLYMGVRCFYAFFFCGKYVKMFCVGVKFVCACLTYIVIFLIWTLISSFFDTLLGLFWLEFLSKNQICAIFPQIFPVRMWRQFWWKCFAGVLHKLKRTVCFSGGRRDPPLRCGVGYFCVVCCRGRSRTSRTNSQEFICLGKINFTVCPLCFSGGCGNHSLRCGY